MSTSATTAPYGVAVIGCGAMGGAHAAAWSARDDARILSVYDPDTARMAALAERTGAAPASSWQAAIETDGVDMVSVCTPICFHAEMTIHAAACGRHVLTEKAIALTLEDADAMIAAAEENAVKLVVAYQHRAAPPHRTWRRLVRDGVLAGPLFIRLQDVRGIRPKTAMHRISENGGPVIDMAGHYFDLVRFFTGAEPLRVSAQGHCFGRGRPQLAAFDDIAIDAAEILVEYTDGHVLSTCVNWGLPWGHAGRGEEYIVSRDTVSTMAAENRVAVRYADREVIYDPEDAPSGTAVRVADLVEAVANDTRPDVAGEDGRVALACCLAALESIETGRTVTLDARAAAG